jgi:hypothetical protein
MQIQDHDELPKFDHRVLPPASRRSLGDSARPPAIPGMPGMAVSHENWGNFKCHKWRELLRHSQRYLIQVVGFNLRVPMRALYGQGTRREAAETLYALIIVLRTEAALVFALIATVDHERAAIAILAPGPDAKSKNRDLVNGLFNPSSTVGSAK